MTKRALKDWKVWAGIIVSIAAMAWAFWDADFSDLRSELGNIRWLFLFAALPLYWIVLVMRSYRWTYFIPRDTSTLRARYNAAAIGFMVTMLLPLRVGEIVRGVVFANREKRSKLECLATIATERVFDMVAILSLAVLCLPFVPIREVILGLKQSTGLIGVLKNTVAAGNEHMLTYIAAAGALLLIAGFYLFCRFGRALVLNGLPCIGFRNKTLMVMVGSIFEGLEAPIKEKKLGAAIGWSLSIWFFICLVYWITLYSMPVTGTGGERSLGSLAGFSGAIFLQVIICFGIALPSVPGFWGVWHAATMVAFIPYMHLAPNLNSKILAYAIIVHLFSYLFTVIFGMEALINEGVTWSEIKSVEARNADRQGTG